MARFYPARGCVYTMTDGNGSGGKGYYHLDGLDGSQASSPVLIQSADLTDRDSVQPVLGLGGEKLVYVFGETFGSVRVNGQVLLGPVGSSASGFQVVSQYFQTHRTSKGGEPVNLSMPGGGYKIYLTGFGVANPDPEYHIQPFMFFGLIAEPAKGSG